MRSHRRRHSTLGNRDWGTTHGRRGILVSPSSTPLFSSAQPTERVADPIVVCALLTQVSSVRKKLYALGFGNVSSPSLRLTLVSHPPHSSFRRTLSWILRASSEQFPPFRTLVSLVVRLPQPS